MDEIAMDEITYSYRNLNAQDLRHSSLFKALKGVTLISWPLGNSISHVSINHTRYYVHSLLRAQVSILPQRNYGPAILPAFSDMASVTLASRS